MFFIKFQMLLMIQKSQTEDERLGARTGRYSNIPGYGVEQVAYLEPHPKDIESNALGKLAIVKKLTRTFWGANSSIMWKVYVSTARPTLNFGSSDWSQSFKYLLQSPEQTVHRRTTVDHWREESNSNWSFGEPYQYTLEERLDNNVHNYNAQLLSIPTHPMHI